MLAEIRRTFYLLLTCVVSSSVAAEEVNGQEPTLVGFSALPADTFAQGERSGAGSSDGSPISANGRVGPFDSQPVQGFSAVQFSPFTSGAFLFLSDNGFGARANSADYLLRIYQALPNFNGEQDVEIIDFIGLSDPQGYVPFDIVNEGTGERLLTGADFDVESFVIDKNSDLWLGDEFGPYLLQFDKNGVLQQAPIPTPQVVNGELDFESFVRSPDYPLVTDAPPTLARSRGFEGMAFSPDRKYIYPMLEGTVEGDPENSLRIYQFDVARSKYSRFVGYYRTDVGRPIGDFTPVNKHQFLVIERDGGQAEKALFKKIFLIDISVRDESGFVAKKELVDLLDIADPNDLNTDGELRFQFPYVTIENVLVLDSRTILVANDNNYPFSIGRGPDIDATEIIKIQLPAPLPFNRRLLRPLKID